MGQRLVILIEMYSKKLKEEKLEKPPIIFFYQKMKQNIKTAFWHRIKIYADKIGLNQ